MKTSEEKVDPEQISILCKIFAEALKTSQEELPMSFVQKVIDVRATELGGDFVFALRKHIEAECRYVSRRVRVNRLQSAHEMIKNSGRKENYAHEWSQRAYVSMPKHEEVEVEVIFFQILTGEGEDYLTNSQVASEYEFRGLKPDPYAHVAVDSVDPAFILKNRTVSLWEYKENKNWYMLDMHTYCTGTRSICAFHADTRWGKNTWFAGVRK